jgi:iron transport multicopper oxidase
MLSLSAFLLAAPVAVMAGVHELWWNITYVDNINPDGLYPRRVVGVNGTWPLVSLFISGLGRVLIFAYRIPPMQVDSNDTLILHAYNGLGDQPTTVHHHGMFFNSTSWMDGANSISQWYRRLHRRATFS